MRFTSRPRQRAGTWDDLTRKQRDALQIEEVRLLAFTSVLEAEVEEFCSREDIDQREFAELIVHPGSDRKHVPPSTLNEWLKGVYFPNEQSLDRLIEVLRLPATAEAELRETWEACQAFVDRLPDFRPIAGFRPSDFSSLGRRLDVQHFVERTSILAKIDRYLENRMGGYIVLEAAGGFGKTSLLYSLAMERGYPCFFPQVLRNPADPLVLVHQIGSALNARMDVNAAYRKAISIARYERSPLQLLLDSVSKKVRGEDGPIVLVIDEPSKLISSPPGASDLITPLPEQLPENVFVVTAHNPGVDPLPPEATRYLIQPTIEQHREDLAVYFRNASMREPLKGRLVEEGISVEAFVDALDRKVNGLWLLGRFLIKELEADRSPRSVYQLDALPDSLRNYYFRCWKRFKKLDPEAWQEMGRGLVATLAAAHEEMSLREICRFGGLDQEEVLASLERLLQQMGPAVQYDDDSGRLTFIHDDSSSEFFHDPSKGSALVVHRGFVREIEEATRTAHHRISQGYLQSWGGLEGGLLDLEAKSDHDLDDGYGLRWLHEHLRAASDEQSLYRLLDQCAPEWFRAQFRAGTPSIYLRTIECAWDCAENAASREVANGNDGVSLALQIRYAFMANAYRNMVSMLPEAVVGALVKVGVLSANELLALINEAPDFDTFSDLLEEVVPLIRTGEGHGEVLDETITRAIKESSLESSLEKFSLFAKLQAILDPSQSEEAIQMLLRSTGGTYEESWETQLEVLSDVTPYLSGSIHEKCVAMMVEIIAEHEISYWHIYTLCSIIEDFDLSQRSIVARRVLRAAQKYLVEEDMDLDYLRILFQGICRLAVAVDIPERRAIATVTESMAKILDEASYLDQDSFDAQELLDVCLMDDSYVGDVQDGCETRESSLTDTITQRSLGAEAKQAGQQRVPRKPPHRHLGRRLSVRQVDVPAEWGQSADEAESLLIARSRGETDDDEVINSLLLLSKRMKSPWIGARFLGERAPELEQQAAQRIIEHAIDLALEAYGLYDADDWFGMSNPNSFEHEWAKYELLLLLLRVSECKGMADAYIYEQLLLLADQLPPGGSGFLAEILAHLSPHLQGRARDEVHQEAVRLAALTGVVTRSRVLAALRPHATEPEWRSLLLDTVQYAVDLGGDHLALDMLEAIAPDLFEAFGEAALNFAEQYLPPLPSVSLVTRMTSEIPGKHLERILARVEDLQEPAEKAEALGMLTPFLPPSFAKSFESLEEAEDPSSPSFQSVGLPQAIRDAAKSRSMTPEDRREILRTWLHDMRSWNVALGPLLEELNQLLNQADPVVALRCLDAFVRALSELRTSSFFSYLSPFSDLLRELGGDRGLEAISKHLLELGQDPFKPFRLHPN